MCFDFNFWSSQYVSRTYCLFDLPNEVDNTTRRWITGHISKEFEVTSWNWYSSFFVLSCYDKSISSMKLYPYTLSLIFDGTVGQITCLTELLVKIFVSTITFIRVPKSFVYVCLVTQFIVWGVIWCNTQFNFDLWKVM